MPGNHDSPDSDNDGVIGDFHGDAAMGFGVGPEQKEPLPRAAQTAKAIAAESTGKRPEKIGSALASGFQRAERLRRFVQWIKYNMMLLARRESCESS